MCKIGNMEKKKKKGGKTTIDPEGNLNWLLW